MAILTNPLIIRAIKFVAKFSNDFAHTHLRILGPPGRCVRNPLPASKQDNTNSYKYVFTHSRSHILACRHRNSVVFVVRGPYIARDMPCAVEMKLTPFPFSAVRLKARVAALVAAVRSPLTSLK